VPASNSVLPMSRGVRVRAYVPDTPPRIPRFGADSPALLRRPHHGLRNGKVRGAFPAHSHHRRVRFISLREPAAKAAVRTNERRRMRMSWSWLLRQGRVAASVAVTVLAIAAELLDGMAE